MGAELRRYSLPLSLCLSVSLPLPLSLTAALVDHRALRLLGEDDHLQARANSGFQRPDEERWTQWASADAEAKAHAAAARL